MKIVYIAHPIGGDIKGNLNKIKEIGRQINLNEPEVIPFAPYYFDLHCLDDNIPKERKRGIENNRELFKRGFIDELRLYGDNISEGMLGEIKLCMIYNIKIVPTTLSLYYQLKAVRYKFSHETYYENLNKLNKS